MEDNSGGHIDFERLAAFLADECKPEEIAMIENWLAQAPENQQTLDGLKEIWNSEPNRPLSLDVDAAWTNVQQQISNDDVASDPKIKRFNPRRYVWIAAAACLVAAIGLTWRFFPKSNPQGNSPEMREIAAGNSLRTDTLSDGTIVSLNADSRLTYPAQFVANERLVRLEGEAFFEVAHNPKQPFRILAGDAEVRVIGTSFNLSTLQETVKVSVQTGKVEFGKSGAAGTEKVFLSKGMAGKLAANSPKVEISQADVENDLFWKTGKLVFKHAPLDQVVHRLNAMSLDTVVELAPNLKNCPMTSTFEKSSIASIVQVIAETFDLEVTQNENIYKISGEACK